MAETANEKTSTVVFWRYEEAESRRQLWRGGPGETLIDNSQDNLLGQTTRKLLRGRSK
jgi:hypothetical protein